jgi:hypothetical protein
MKKALSIEEVLADEVQIIHGKTLSAKAKDQDAQEKRKNLNADKRSLNDRDGDDVQPRDEFYIDLNKLNQAALCCSGGGIRSATFCLGIMQAFANYDVDAGELRGKAAAIARSDEAGATAPPGDQAGAAAGSKSGTYTPIDPKVSALGRFHYLSTVSGGGYIGSWLSAWRSRSDFSTVIANLTSRPNGPDIEPPEISWLRAYSNYLTPTLGITSADSWAAVAISLRNLILNWLVIIPVVCLALLMLKLIAAVSVWVAHDGDKFYPQYHLPFLFAVFGIGCLMGAQAFTTRFRPSRRIDLDGVIEGKFFKHDLVLAVLSAMAVTIFLSSHYFISTVLQACGATQPDRPVDLRLVLPLGGAVVGCVVYIFGWLARYCVAGAQGPKEQQQILDILAWAASGLVYGAVVGFGVYLYSLSAPYADNCQPTVHVLHLLIPMILGVPWVLMAQLLAEIIFVGFTSKEKQSDPDREWLGRAAGWLAAAAVAWALVAFLVFAGGYFVQDPDSRYRVSKLTHQVIVALGGITGIISGLVTALLGSSSKTPAKSKGRDQGGISGVISNVALAVAGPIFVAVLIVALSVGLDRMLLEKSFIGFVGDTDYSLIKILQIGHPVDLGVAAIWLLAGLLIVAAVAVLASCFVNINRFSLHALYRNRLTRCYLGASNQKRHPDEFSGFDFSDNLCVHKLWPPKSGGVVNSLSLFHVVNIALNVVSTKRLAWQERKAESFTVSPRHCGAAYLGFRESENYGGKTKDKNNSGLSLGTAMAISGAAVSPNMGYHSSPSIALLLTLFNVRLGWWLGNPGKAGKDTYTAEGPKWAVEPLFAEAFGLTNDDSPYVYLSDGGHFENLGLYEMVRRRCRLIVVVDAGCDPDFAFEDLGNAVRKIYIDLGIRITFSDLGSLADRPSVESRSRAKLDAAALAIIHAADRTKKKGEQGSKIGPPGDTPYHAIGVIHYREADHTKPVAHVETVETVEIVETAETIEIVDTVETVETREPPEIVENGYILYIKPAYHGTEKIAGIRSYATANPTFPHETTADQWFTESQFESYRSLGLDIGSRILNHEVVLRAEPKLTLHDALRALKVQTPP